MILNSTNSYYKKVVLSFLKPIFLFRRARQGALQVAKRKNFNANRHGKKKKQKCKEKTSSKKH